MDIETKIQELEVKAAVLGTRLGKIEADVSDIHRLATAAELLAQQMSQMQSTIDGIGDRLDCLETAPAKTYNSIKTTIISSIITALIGAIAGGVLALIIK